MFWYIIGLLAGDGYLYDRKYQIGWVLNKKENEIQNRIINFLKVYQRLGFVRKIHVIERKDNSVEIKIYSKRMFNLFKKFCEGKGRYKRILIYPSELVKKIELFSGLFDAEGSVVVYRNSPRAFFVTASEYIRATFEKLLQDLNIRYYIYNDKSCFRFKLAITDLRKINHMSIKLAGVGAVTASALSVGRSTGLSYGGFFNITCSK